MLLEFQTPRGWWAWLADGNDGDGARVEVAGKEHLREFSGDDGLVAGAPGPGGQAEEDGQDEEGADDAAFKHASILIGRAGQCQIDLPMK